MKVALPLETIAKLGKVIPRLASDHDGEILATVAAIRRTLEGVGHDLNDLGKHIAESNPFAAIGLEPGWPYTPSRPSPQAKPTPPAKPAKPAQPRVPTFWTLSHFARCEWLDRFVSSPLIAHLAPAKRAAFDELRAKIVRRPQEILSRKETRMFNDFVAATWALGRKEKEAA